MNKRAEKKYNESNRRSAQTFHQRYDAELQSLNDLVYRRRIGVLQAFGLVEALKRQYNEDQGLTD